MHPREEQLNDYLEGALEPREHAEVARHLDACAECALFVAQLQRVIGDARAMPLLAPPERTWAAIEHALTGQRAEGRGQKEATPPHPSSLLPHPFSISHPSR